jgi:large subunit ribosomal protein L24|tara:strand:+ start:609 stop:1079 length:471 start_codon:yes stop_codon:yes gene_type:complete
MVKPTKMRNRMLFQATLQTRSKQMGANLSKDLQKKYGKKSARVIEGDSITIVRGEFKGVDGKVAKISPQKSSVAIEGVKKEKTKGDKFDVYIHTSNLIITSLNSDDKWRMAKLQGKDPKKQPKETTTKENTKETTTKENTKETKVEKEVKKKENEK